MKLNSHLRQRLIKFANSAPALPKGVDDPPAFADPARGWWQPSKNRGGMQGLNVDQQKDLINARAIEQQKINPNAFSQAPEIQKQIERATAGRGFRGQEDMAAAMSRMQNSTNFREQMRKGPGYGRYLGDAFKRIGNNWGGENELSFEGKPIYGDVYEDDGLGNQVRKMRQEVDGEGNPAVDEAGNPIMVPVRQISGWTGEPTLDLAANLIENGSIMAATGGLGVSGVGARAGAGLTNAATRLGTRVAGRYGGKVLGGATKILTQGFGLTPAAAAGAAPAAGAAKGLASRVGAGLGRNARDYVNWLTYALNPTPALLGAQASKATLGQIGGKLIGRGASGALGKVRSIGSGIGDILSSIGTMAAPVFATGAARGAYGHAMQNDANYTAAHPEAGMFDRVGQFGTALAESASAPGLILAHPGLGIGSTIFNMATGKDPNMSYRSAPLAATQLLPTTIDPEHNNFRPDQAEAYASGTPDQRAAQTLKNLKWFRGKMDGKETWAAKAMRLALQGNQPWVESYSTENYVNDPTAQALINNSRGWDADKIYGPPAQETMVQAPAAPSYPPM